MIMGLAKMQVIRPDVDPEDDAGDVQERPEELRLLEAMLFAASEPLSEKDLAARLPQGTDVQDALKRLQQDYASRGVNLVRVGGKWTFRTAGDLSWLLSKETVETRKLSRAAIETLAIIAYHQPVTRTEIEDIRGVSTSKGSIDVLLETGWIKPRGRRKVPGRPLTCRISGSTRSATCPASKSSRALACSMAVCRLALPCRCRQTIRRCARMKTRSSRAISTLASRHVPSAPRSSTRTVIQPGDAAVLRLTLRNRSERKGLPGRLLNKAPPRPRLAPCFLRA
jgi:segregation and condensation protein B